MMGALLMLGIQPGPLLFTKHPDIAWGVIASMFIGNIILAIVNIPLAGILVRVLAIPGRILYSGCTWFIICRCICNCKQYHRFLLARNLA